MPKTKLPLTNDEEANRLLVEDPLALLIGMLLDQQVPMEKAFHAPFELRERLGGTLDANVIASTEPDQLAEVFRQRPALHRFPASMAARTQALARTLVEKYDGRAEKVWAEARSGRELFRRIEELPGFGEQKARIFLALLAKRLGVAPTGWKEYAGQYGMRGYFSVADIDGPDALARVREHKRAVKADAEARPSSRLPR